MTDSNGVARRRVLSVLVDNEPGVLARIIGLFSGRGWNIDGLTVAPVLSSRYKERSVSRMTIVTSASDDHLPHVVDKIRSLVPVLDVQDITHHEDRVEADITLAVAITCDPVVQTQISQMAWTQFRAMAIRTKPKFIVLRFVGQDRAAQDFVEAIRRFGVEVETAHSGPVAIAFTP